MRMRKHLTAIGTCVMQARASTAEEFSRSEYLRKQAPHAARSGISTMDGTARLRPDEGFGLPRHSRASGAERTQSRLRLQDPADEFVDDLRDANLGPLVISGDRLMPSQLGKADLRNVDFRGADLNHAGLIQADASYANFTGANLRRTDFSNAVLEGATLARDQLRETLTEGSSGLRLLGR